MSCDFVVITQNSGKQNVSDPLRVVTLRLKKMTSPFSHIFRGALSRQFGSAVSTILDVDDEVSMLDGLYLDFTCIVGAECRRQKLVPLIKHSPQKQKG